jgi:hypothetical protein
VALRQDALDRAVLGAIIEVLHSDILIQAVESPLAKLGSVRKVPSLPTRSWPGSSPRKPQKIRVLADLAKLEQVAQVKSLDTAIVSLALWERVRGVPTLLGAHTAQARQIPRKLLSDKIEWTPVGAGRKRGYQFRGALTIDRLIGGEALQASLSMVAPTGAAASSIPLRGLLRVA